MVTSHPIRRGVACPGCPHRAAYVACREALGRGRARVICGDAGCAAVGSMHPAACTCVGGEEALLDRYKVPVPQGRYTAGTLLRGVHPLRARRRARP